MSDLLALLEVEEKNLEEALMAQPGYRKLLKIREAIAEYKGQNPETAAIPAGYKLVPLTKEESIREAATAHLKAAAGLAQRRNIARDLADKGLIPGDQSGVRMLAVYMARWPEFIGRGRGWVAYEPDPAKRHLVKKETAATSPS